jgi:flagellar biosynthesis protein FlhF
MRIRVLKAASMPEAIARLREELGPDAALLSSRPVAGGVEVTGGLDLPEEEELPVLIGARPRPPRRPARAARPADDGAAIALDFHRVPGALARRLCTAPLEASLEASLRFAPLPDGVARPLLLAGPPGAGKTLTCAKLAARRVLEGEEPPLVISADAERPAAADQLAAFTKLLGATLAVALTPAAAALAMESRSPGQPVLIDTAGCDPFDPAQARMIAQLIAVTGATVALVLPASTDAAEAADLARAFGALGATHLVATRLDASRRIGAVLAAAATAGLALAEAGTGSQAADGLTVMEPAWLAARLRQRSHIHVSAWEGVQP